MKKILFIFLIISLYSSLYSLEKKEDQIKRTVLILPFVNKNKVEKYEYLKETLLNALSSELLHTETFDFVNQLKLDQLLTKKGGAEYFENIKNAKETALDLKADVIVTGEYIIIEDKILVQIKAFDIFSEQTAASTNIKGELGTDLFRIIEDSVKDIAGKMSKNLKKIDKTYFTEMQKLLKQKENFQITASLTPVNRTGIALTSAGGGFLIIGIPILIYDLAGYSMILRDKKSQYTQNEISFNDYNAAYQTFIGLFVSSVVISTLGLTMVSVGIPLTIYKSKNFKVSLNYKISEKQDLFVGFNF